MRGYVRLGGVAVVGVAAMALAAWSATPDIHGEYVKYASAGDSVRAYLAYPERRDAAPGIIVIHEHLKSHLGYQVDGVLRSPVDLGVPALTSEATCLADGHPLDAKRLKCGLHFVQHMGLDDCCYQLHAVTS